MILGKRILKFLSMVDFNCFKTLYGEMIKTNNCIVYSFKLWDGV